MKLKTMRTRRMHARASSLAAIRFKAATAKAQGRRHETEGAACPDAVARITKSRFTAIALADGAGMACHATGGASISVAMTVRHLLGHFDMLLASNEERAKAGILATVRRALRREARNRSSSVED